jgi:hypothetical protein
MTKEAYYALRLSSLPARQKERQPFGAAFTKKKLR